MDSDGVRQWVDDYERAWRSPGTDRLNALFTDGATYQMSPWASPVTGRDAVAELWGAEREGPDEEFTMTSEVVAVDGDVAVVRVEVDYPSRSRWRDLWVLRFAPDGRCASFEEWPFAPDQPAGH